MGNKSTKGQVITTKKPPAVPEGPPYPGPSVQYFFLNTEVSMTSQIHLFGSSMITTDVDNYYPLLASKYSEGFRLLTFYRIPCASKLSGLKTVVTPFQGIFCRDPAAPLQLRIEKSLLVTQNIHNGLINFSLTQGQVSDTTHLYQAILNNTQNGGRLVCIEMTGGMQSQGFKAASHGISPKMAVDLFFEIPTSPNSERYVYQSVPIPFTTESSFSFSGQDIRVICDWNGNLANLLSQGWRLVEIFKDQTMTTQQSGLSVSSAMNAIWFFEKPASCIEDCTPRYQGMVVEHWMDVVGGFRGTSAKTGWEPVIEQLGGQGWELACILETPEVRRNGLASVRVKVLLFLQRLILPPLSQAACFQTGTATGYTPELHPSYEEVAKQ